MFFFQISLTFLINIANIATVDVITNLVESSVAENWFGIGLSSNKQMVQKDAMYVWPMSHKENSSSLRRIHSYSYS